MTRRMWMVVAVVVAVGAADPALARKRKNITEFEVDWRPQQSVAAAEVTIHRSMRDRAAELVLTDDRPGKKPEYIGTRTDGKDRLYDLSATNDVVAFVKGVMHDQMERWGVATGDGDLVLEGELTNYEVTERNQALGATYRAEVELSFALKDRSGKELWTGDAYGDATRYGKAYSKENCNEVLSDALLEAWANLLSNYGLHTAWDGE